MTKRKLKTSGRLKPSGELTLKKDVAIVKFCYINPSRPVRCAGECRGASTHWYWESCGYGKKMQHTQEEG